MAVHYMMNRETQIREPNSIDIRSTRNSSLFLAFFYQQLPSLVHNYFSAGQRLVVAYVVMTTAAEALAERWKKNEGRGCRMINLHLSLQPMTEGQSPGTVIR